MSVNGGSNEEGVMWRPGGEGNLEPCPSTLSVAGEWSTEVSWIGKNSDSIHPQFGILPLIQPLILENSLSWE